MSDWSHTHILNDLRRCTKCTLPETHEMIEFDDEGVCNVCRSHQTKKEVDWDEREKQLMQLLEKYRGKHPYDCIVPFSGGKDSTFTLWYIVKKLGLKPLVVSFDHGFYRPKILENNEKTMRNLGVDYIKFRTDWKVVRKLMKIALRLKGDFDWHAHVGTFAYPMQVALKEKVPLIFWGEHQAEYTTYVDYKEIDIVDESRNDTITNLGITAEEMVKITDEKITLRDLQWCMYPKKEELEKLGVFSVTLGSYVPWDVKKNSEIISNEIGWEGDQVEGVPPKYSYEKIEYQLQGPRDYLKFIKRGYARTTHLTSLDIRNERMERDEAKELIEKYEGKRPASLDYILKIIDITEEEWREMALANGVSPYKHDFSKEQNGEVLWDMEKWDWDP
mgnify:CR=1 FL=1|jgi:N-acetyl sugar amidotransferase